MNKNILTTNSAEYADLLLALSNDEPRGRYGTIRVELTQQQLILLRQLAEREREFQEENEFYIKLQKDSE